MDVTVQDRVHPLAALRTVPHRHHIGANINATACGQVIGVDELIALAIVYQNQAVAVSSLGISPVR